MQRTRLASLRISANVSQRELAEATGIPIASYRRLERGQIDNPPFRWLVNCYLALGLDYWEYLIEPDWLAWKQLRPDAPAEPPDLSAFLANQQ